MLPLYLFRKFGDTQITPALSRISYRPAGICYTVLEWMSLCWTMWGSDQRGKWKRKKGQHNKERENPRQGNTRFYMHQNSLTHDTLGTNYGSGNKQSYVMRWLRMRYSHNEAQPSSPPRQTAEAMRTQEHPGRKARLPDADSRSCCNGTES